LSRRLFCSFLPVSADFCGFLLSVSVFFRLPFVFFCLFLPASYGFLSSSACFFTCFCHFLPVFLPVFAYDIYVFYTKNAADTRKGHLPRCSSNGVDPQVLICA